MINLINLHYTHDCPINYAHNYPIILELLSLKWMPNSYSPNYAGTLGSSLT